MLICCMAFIAFVLYFIPSHTNYVRQHDEFDGNFSSRHLLVKSGQFFETNPTATVMGSMNGLPRAVFVRFTEPVALLMYFFGSLTGYAISFVLIRLVAFLGIFLIGRDFLKFNKQQYGILFLVALCFACLPYNTSYCLSICGTPLAFWAFLNIITKNKIKVSLLTLFLYALSSNFILVGFHVCVVFFCIACWYSIKSKKINWLPFIAIMVLGVSYVLSDYMLFYNHLFNSSYQSSRLGFDKELSLNLKGVIGVSFLNFFTGEYNSAHYFGYLFIPFILYFLYTYYKYKSEDAKKGLLFFTTLIFCAMASAIFDWEKMSGFYNVFSFAKVFNLKRFISLVPGLFFCVALISVLTVTNMKSKVASASVILVLILCFTLEWRGNMARVLSSFDCKGITIKGDSPHTFDEFFNTQLYKDIKKEIGNDTTSNVVNFGLLPSACKYAGIKVLDDYQGDYPLSYKLEFRKVIAGELNKSEALKDLFDNWGSKCYLWSSNSFENKLSTIKGFALEPSLNIDTKQLLKLNCKYILSSIIIGNSKELGLNPQKVFVSRVNNQAVILYKITS